MAKKTESRAGSARRMPGHSKNTLIVYGNEEVTITRGRLSKAYGVVNVHDLEQNVKEFVKKIGGIITQLPTEVGAFELGTVTLSAEVGAKGSVCFLGTGGEMEGRGGITFEFKRPDKHNGK